MSTATKKEYINLLRERYEFTSRKQRQRILDELCTTLGYHKIMESVNNLMPKYFLGLV